MKIIVLLFFGGWAALYSLNAAIDAPTVHLDGAFQTASGLYRLDSGQIPGRDFFPYLGVGPLFLLFPVFKSLGANLFASVFSAQITTLVLGWLSLSILWQLHFRPRLFIDSLVVGAFILACSITILARLPYQLYNAAEFLGNPGNSLRPIRSALPYVVAIIYYFWLLRIKTPQTKVTLSGIVTGIILLWSNDFAIPTAGLFAILIVFDLLKTGELKWGGIALYLLILLLSWTTLLTLATQGHSFELLRYNFFDVAKDQWWYFGPYGESSRVFELEQAFRLVSEETAFPLVMLGLVVVVAVVTRTIENVLLLWIGFVLLSGGVLASVGGHIGGYFGGFYSWGMAVLLFLVLKLFLFVLKKVTKSDDRVLFCFYGFSVFIVFVIMISATMLLLRQYRINLDSAKTDPNRFYVEEIGGYLGTEWKDYINRVRNTDSRKVIEEYWGLWSATRKIFPLWPVDSVIHALGQTRRVAVEALKNAEIIISTRNTASLEWQPWSFSQNFWFYDELMRNWTPYMLSPKTIVWHKKEEFLPLKNIECHVINGEMALALDTEELGFYRVGIHYNFIKKGRHLLMIKNNISYGKDASGYVSIDPDSDNALFPVYLVKKNPPQINMKVIGVQNYDLNINSCFASKIAFTDDEVLHAPEVLSGHFDPKYSLTVRSRMITY